MPASFSIDSPSPDAGHEAIRVAVVQAIADLGATTDTAGLLQMIVGFFQNNIDSLLADLSAVHVQLDDVTARLSALEP